MNRKGTAKNPICKKWWLCAIAALVISMLYTGCVVISDKDDPGSSNSVVSASEPSEIPDSDPVEITSESDQSDSVSGLVDSSDWEIITRDGHPTYYGSVAISHSVWDDVERRKIIFADGYDNWGDMSILSMTAYRNSDLIRGIYVSVSNFDEPIKITVDEILPVVASYMPYEIMDKYYQFRRSQLIVPDETKNTKDKYYVITYGLTEEGSTAYHAKEHEYSGSIDVVIETNENDVVENFDIKFGAPRWMASLEINSMHEIPWDCDLYDYRVEREAK